MNWPVNKLNAVCEISMGQAPDGSTYNHSADGLPLVAGAGDFGDYFPSVKKYTSAPGKRSAVGDIILCIRATIGDTNWSDKEYCLGRGVAGLRARDGLLNSRFLWHFISGRRSELEARGTGSTFKQVSRADIAEWLIPTPPVAEQRRERGETQRQRVEGGGAQVRQHGSGETATSCTLLTAPRDGPHRGASDALRSSPR